MFENDDLYVHGVLDEIVHEGLVVNDISIPFLDGGITSTWYYNDATCTLANVELYYRYTYNASGTIGSSRSSGMRKGLSAQPLS